MLQIVVLLQISCVNYSCMPSYFSNCTIISYYLVVKFYFVSMSIYINKQKHYLIAKFISYLLIVFLWKPFLWVFRIYTHRIMLGQLIHTTYYFLFWFCLFPDIRQAFVDVFGAAVLFHLTHVV